MLTLQGFVLNDFDLIPFEGKNILDKPMVTVMLVMCSACYWVLIKRINHNIIKVIAQLPMYQYLIVPATTFNIAKYKY